MDPTTTPERAREIEAARLAEAQRARRSRLALAAFLVGAGTLHFAAPTPYDRIIPAWLPGRPRWWTSASGVAEIASGALVAFPRTRKVGAWAAVATFIGVYPANVQMALDHPPQTLLGAAAWARLPLQVPIVAWALRHARDRRATTGEARAG